MNRAETTLPEIAKKIQTLRTQFGQEVNKIEKSTTLGDDLIYKPKIWWFPHLEWIGDFMKTRTDSTPLSARAKVKRTVHSKDELFEFEYENEETTEPCYTTIEYSEYEVDKTDGEPSIKKQKTYQKPIRAAHISDKEEDNGVQTIEYTLINEDTSEVVPVPEERLPQYVEYQEADTLSRPADKFKRRSKAFGKYVSALLRDITDDKIFFELQKSITDSIHEATIKQQGLKKS